MSTSQASLSGRVALITGAGRGCGEAVARAVAAAGARVCACDLNPDRADRVAGEIAAAGGQAFGWQADVSNKFQVGSLIETVRDQYGRIDLLIHHAHVGPRAALLAMDEWEWRRTIEVNLTGAFLCAQMAGRVMSDEGGGSIVLLRKPIPPGDFGALAASQAGLTALAAALSAELAGKAVRVSTCDADTPDETVRRVMSLLNG